MNNYLWNKKNVDLEPDEIAPWKLTRDRHDNFRTQTQNK